MGLSSDRIFVCNLDSPEGKAALGQLTAAASEGSVEATPQEYHAITQALRRIEAGLADELGRREILERDLAGLKQHVAALQSRIEEIEQRLGR